MISQESPSIPAAVGPAVVAEQAPIPIAPSKTAALGPRELARRAAIDIAYIAAFGLALGAHRGGAELFVHAALLPIGLVVALLVTAPALFIVLAWTSTPVRPELVGRGLLDAFDGLSVALGGLAPACVLYLVSSDLVAARWVAAAALVVGGVAFVARLLAAIHRDASIDALMRTGAFSLIYFGVGCAFAHRIFAATLPLFGGHLVQL